MQAEKKKAMRIFQNGTRSRRSSNTSSCHPSMCKLTIRRFTNCIKKERDSRENDEQTMIRFLEGLEPKERNVVELAIQEHKSGETTKD